TNTCSCLDGANTIVRRGPRHGPSRRQSRGGVWPDVRARDHRRVVPRSRRRRPSLVATSSPGPRPTPLEEVLRGWPAAVPPVGEEKTAAGGGARKWPEPWMKLLIISNFIQPR